MSRLAPIGLAVLACLLVLLGAWGAALRGEAYPALASIQMAVDSAGPGQLFWPGSNGYSEPESERFGLEHGQGMREYLVELTPSAPLDRIRLDPGAAEGTVMIQRVELAWGSARVELQGEALAAAVRPLNQLEPIADAASSGAVSLRSSGGDPFLEILLPTPLPDPREQNRVVGSMLLAAAGLGLLLLAWQARGPLLALGRRALGGRAPLLFAGLVALAALLLLDVLGVGCGGPCSPRGIGYGGLLFAASLGCIAVGLVVLRSLGLDRGGVRPRLFLALLAGQAALVLYVALRSVVHAWLPWAPLTAPELLLCVVAAAAWLAHGARRRAPVVATRWREAGNWLALELVLLAVVCVVIGERELPRLVMLSSDPDTHAYFARQLELGGGVPWWGDARFHYPAGTAILGFLWAKLGFLDVRNALAALPLLQAFLAALVLAEAAASRTRDIRLVLMLFMAALGLTGAAFLVPLYSQYAHMEGAGRQMAIASLAMLPAVAMARRPAGPGWGAAVVVVLALFVLALLNPINVVVPLVVLAGYGIHRLASRHGPGAWLLVPPALVPLLLLDPYYLGLIAGGGTPESRFTVDAALPVKAFPDVLVAWLSRLGEGPGEFLHGNTQFLPGRGPLFAGFASVLAALLVWLRPRGMRGLGPASLAVTVVVVGLWAADALFDVLVDDRRFYLLAPYYWLSLAQLKILLVTGLLLAVVLAAARRRLSWWLVGGLATVVVAAAFFAVHGRQQFMDRPRVDYCGSLGCAEVDDLAVLEEFEVLAQAGSLKRGRVLLPNSRHEAHREKWIFPVTGARALPFFEVPQAAFYYYQGDADFTTANYVRHVCERFDRDWLRSQEIAYVFLPSRRGAACMAGMESLPETDTVLLRRGDSMIVELR